MSFLNTKHLEKELVNIMTQIHNVAIDLKSTQTNDIDKLSEILFDNAQRIARIADECNKGMVMVIET